jgi:hypothetical protein
MFIEPRLGRGKQSSVVDIGFIDPYAVIVTAKRVLRCYLLRIAGRGAAVAKNSPL